jgi:hypothetical protein
MDGVLIEQRPSMISCLEQINLPHKERFMKSRLTLITSLIFVLLVVATMAVSASSRNYRTHLAGRFEAPVRVTNAQGEAKFAIKDDRARLHYKLNVANIQNVWMAHIHLGPAGANGPIVV